MGADCILLIAACLDDAELADFEAQRARARHGGAGRGARRAPSSSGRSRLRRRWSASTTATCAPSRCRSRRRWRCCRGFRPGALVVTESGILAPADVARMRAAGVHAFLVGEAFMRAPDPGVALASLIGDEGERLSARRSRRCRRRGRQCCRAGRASGSRRCRRCVERGLGRPRRSPPRTRFALCGWSRRTTVKVVVIGQDPVPDRRSCRRPGVLGREGPAALAGRGSSRCWPPTGPASSAARGLEARRLGAPGRAAAQSGVDGRGRAHRQPYGLWLAGAHSSRSSHATVSETPPPVFLLWGAQGAGVLGRRPSPGAARSFRDPPSVLRLRPQPS